MVDEARRTRATGPAAECASEGTVEDGPDGARDVMDVGIALWARERPDLDASAKAVTGRVLRLHDIILKAFNAALERHGLGYADYAVIATIRASGPPFEMTPSQLHRMMAMSSGGLSKVLGRLDRQGWIERSTASNDRRQVLVALTVDGRRLADEAMATQAQVEQELLSALSAHERDEAARLLKKLILSSAGQAFL